MTGPISDGDARARTLFDAAFDAVVTMDADGRIVEVNAVAEQIFGRSAREMVGQDLAELMIPEDLREPHRRGLATYVATGAGRVVDHPVEMPALRADGTEFPVELAIRRLPVPAPPEPPLFLGFVRDITERLRTENELRELAAEQAALHRFAALVARGVPLREVVDAVTKEIGRLLGAQTSNAIRYDSAASASVLGGWNVPGVNSVPVGSIVRIDDADTVAARIYRTKQPARLDSYEGHDSELANMLRGLGFQASVGAPIFVEGELWGALLVSSVKPEPFPSGVEDRIGAFAELTAQALANAEAREELRASRARIVEAADAARRRIERDLHDGAQQRLVSLALTLRRASALLEHDPAAAREALSEASEGLDQALAELRELARGIHPAVLSEHGLPAALAALADRAPLMVELDMRLAERPRQAVEAAAYYVVAEALTNVVRYAGAPEARVIVERMDGRLSVEVADDGCGGADPGSGSGLRGLSDRVEALGGRLEVRSPAGEGTVVRAELPWS
jgi:PAS domain S-box-containing protein